MVPVLLIILRQTKIMYKRKIYTYIIYINEDTQTPPEYNNLGNHSFLNILQNTAMHFNHLSPCSNLQEISVAPFSLGALSEFKRERLQFPDPAYCILNFCFLKPILRRDKFQLLGCQQEEPRAVVFIAPYSGRGWIEKGEWFGTGKAHAGHTHGCAMGTVAESRSSPQPAVRQLSWLAALHNLDRLCLSAKKRSERQGRVQEGW